MAKIYYNPNEDELIPMNQPEPAEETSWLAKHSVGVDTFLRSMGILLVSIGLLAALAGCLIGAFTFMFRWQSWIFFVLALVAILLYKMAIVKLVDPDFVYFSI